MPAPSAHRLLAVAKSPATPVGVIAAAATLAGSLAQLSHGGVGGIGSGEPGSGNLDVVGGLLAVASTVPLVAWSRGPRTTFALTALVTVLLSGLGYPLDLPLGPTAALYLLAASRADGDRWDRRTGGLILGLFAAFLGARALSTGDFPASQLLHGGLAWAVAWFAGERTRLRRAHLAELRERADRAEREAESDRRLAAAEERARIARDLHDSAGHAINVIAVRAGTARMRRDPERSQAALEAIEELARKTAAEIDQIVGTLRERASEHGAVDVPSGLASLDTLVARHAAAGLRVTVSSEGAPRPLESPVDQAAYRILQEALTNAARHGTGTAQVELVFGDAEVALTISNEPAGDARTREKGGHGLIGMRERATLLGGSLDVRSTNGAFRVEARLPYLGGLQ